MRPHLLSLSMILSVSTFIGEAMPSLPADVELKDLLRDYANQRVEAYAGDSPAPTHATILRFQDILARDPNSVTALMGLGKVYLLLGQVRDASHFFHRTLEVEANHPEALYLAAVLDAKDGASEESLDHIQVLGRLVPNHEEVARLQAFLHSRLGAPERAIDMLESLLTRNGSSVEVQFDLATYYILAEREREGIELLESLAAESSMSEDVYHNLTIASFRLRDYEQAIQSVQTLLSLKPLRLRYRRFLAGLYLLDGKNLQAENEIDLLTRIGDRSAVTLYLQGCLAANKSSWKEARFLARQALLVNNEYRPAKVLLFLALSQEPGDEEAKRLQQEIRTDPYCRKIVEQVGGEDELTVNNIVRATITLE